MPCTINLRHDQNSGLIKSSQNEGITIYAPEWVQEGLQLLALKLQGVTFNVYNNKDSSSPGEEVIDTFTLTDSGDVPLSLVQLQKIARNERRNNSGIIKTANYKPDISDDAVIYALKDLVRQCIIVGLDKTTHFGGYGSARVAQKVPVYIVDLIGLQFQQPCNTGRLVLCRKSCHYEGSLDQLIYQNVVGEPKKSFNQIQEMKNSSGSEPTSSEFDRRYVPIGHDTYFDVTAYKRFVAADVIVCLLGLNHTVNTYSKDTKCEIHFKFLKYGAGYFAGPKCGPVINQHLLDGVIDGLEQFFNTYKKEESSWSNRITSFEFPFFQCTPSAKKRLDVLCNQHSIQYKFSRQDALEMTAPNKSEYIVATTNCADPHAVTGNEMGFSSVDSVIAENLKSCGNIFSPVLNSKIQSQFIKLL